MTLPRSIARQEISRCFSVSCSDEGDIVIVFVEITSRQHWSVPPTRGCLTFERHCQLVNCISSESPFTLAPRFLIILRLILRSIGIDWQSQKDAPHHGPDFFSRELLRCREGVGGKALHHVSKGRICRVGGWIGKMQMCNSLCISTS